MRKEADHVQIAGNTAIAAASANFGIRAYVLCLSYPAV